MKLFQLVFMICLGIGMMACKGDSSVKDDARESLETPESNANSTVTPQPLTPEAVGQTVAHYICPNNCEGSGGPGAGTCPVCGTAYVHNQAFHNNQNTTTQTNPGQGDVQINQVPNPTAGTGQNAAGVWHYTCPNGCEGGGASAGPCASCGTTLVHNTAYHNN